MLIPYFSASENDELVGPPEASYLSNAAPFRLAKSEVQLRQRSAPQPLSSSPNMDLQNLSSVTRGPPPISAIQPDTRLSETGTIFPSQELSSNISNSGEAQPLYADTADNSMPIPELLDQEELSVDDYIRLAEEMSTYITWDAAVAPN